LSPDDDQQETQIREVPNASAGAETSVSNKVVEEPVPVPTQSWAPAGGESPAEAQERGDEAASDPFSDRPHVWVAGAFVGGIVFAQILKRLGGGDD
jgi:hypothetical protein